MPQIQICLGLPRPERHEAPLEIEAAHGSDLAAHGSDIRTIDK